MAINGFGTTDKPRARQRLVNMAVRSAVMAVENQTASALEALVLLGEEIDRRIAHEIPDTMTEVSVSVQEVLNG